MAPCLQKVVDSPVPTTHTSIANKREDSNKNIPNQVQRKIK